MSNVPFRKPRGSNPPDLDPFSTALREARDQIGQRNFAAALSALNTLSTGVTDPIRLSQVLALVGDCQARQGKVADALATYQSASNLVSKDSVAWLRPVIAQVMVLLSNAQVAEAKTVADAAVLQAQSFEEQYQAQLTQAANQVPTGGTVTVMAQPFPASVVVSRLGNLFLREGELDLAEGYLQQALDLEPNSLQAHMGLAKIASQSGDQAAAITHATTALTIGQYGAGTLEAWSILFKAHRVLGTTINASLLTGVASVGGPVAGRAILEVIKNLRISGNTAWKTRATAWLAAQGATHPVMAAELRKLLLADSRWQGTAAVIQVQANALLAIPGLSPGEFLSAAKLRIRSAAALGQTLPILPMTSAAAQFDAGVQVRILHGLGLACAAAGNFEAGATLLQQCLAQSTTGSAAQSRAYWALAKLAKKQQNYAQAAAYYAQCLATGTGTVRMQLYTQLEWARCLYLSEDQSNIDAAQSALAGMLNGINNYELALDIARQLINAPVALQPLFQSFRVRGEMLAQQALEGATDSGVAATILFKLARRQADFGDYESVLEDWNGLDEAKKLWLWNAGGDFWNYLGMVFDGFRQTKNWAGLKSLSDFYLNDSATPPAGLGILGVRYGLYQVQQKQYAAALTLFQKLVKLVPGQMDCAYAYYWIAISQWLAGQPAQAKQSALSILQVLGSQPGMKWQKALATRAKLFANNLIPPAPPDDAIQTQLDLVNADLQKFEL